MPVVIKFKQKRWLESYISSNTYFRTIAENDLGKDTNKLSFNSFSGKSIQSERNEKGLCIDLNKKLINKHASSIHIKDISFISEDLELIEKHKKSSLTLDKPIFTGQTYLDKSKILLYAIKYV